MLEPETRQVMTIVMLWVVAIIWGSIIVTSLPWIARCEPGSVEAIFTGCKP